jgi:tetratricopeptide (TPR) repeat protein
MCSDALKSSLKSAVTTCEDILARDPGHTEVRYLLAVVTLKLGRAFEALEHAKALCDDDPYNLRFYTLLTSCFMQGGSFQEGKLSAERFVKLAPGHIRALKSLGLAECKIRERERLLKSTSRPLLSQSDANALSNNFHANYSKVPIIINSRDRLYCLKLLVRWLQNAGYLNIAVLDNASTYPPLRNYLCRIQGEVLVYRLSDNLGHRALWTSGIAETLCGVPFVYTDPDVLPTENCPTNLVARLFDLLQLHPQVVKAGVGLRIDDLPNEYKLKEAVITCEAQYWRHPLEGDCYDAPVDTTFALYRSGSWYDLTAVRSGAPYLARHLPWYQNSSSPRREDVYYAQHVKVGTTHWTRRSIQT